MDRQPKASLSIRDPGSPLGSPTLQRSESGQRISDESCELMIIKRRPMTDVRLLDWGS
jgi:hypothetical protein